MSSTPAPIGHTPLPWHAKIWRHSGRPDTVCIKDSSNREIIGWTGFDGTPCTKAEVRQNARFVSRACNSHYELLEALRNLVDRHFLNGGSLKEPAYLAAKAAIRKATEQSS